MREKQGGVAAGAQDLGDDTMGYDGKTGQRRRATTRSVTMRSFRLCLNFQGVISK
jgi:hypothetical protein